MRRVDRYRRQEKRSRSQVIEMAVEEFLRSREAGDEIVTSGGSFEGEFDRAWSYER